MSLQKKITGFLGCIVILGGCATVNQKAGFPEIRAEVEERKGIQIVWNGGSELDKQAVEKIRSLLKQSLTVDEAVQVALLNNRQLQATYSELGVAQADLVQAGLLKNPIFDAAILYSMAHGGPPDLELSVVMNFLDVFFMPLRKRVAAARFEDAKLQVTGAVLDLANEVRRAFFIHQANEQMLELRETTLKGVSISFEVAKRLHEAGNISDLDLFRERAQTEGAKLQLASAEAAARQSREQLNTLMGLWGRETEWESAGRMPDIPVEPVRVDGIENVVLQKSLDLAIARQRIIVAGEQLGVSKWTALMPEFHSGPLGEREERSWEVGPVLEFPIPLFDQGQGQVGRNAAELRRAQQEYYALAVRIRSTARTARDRMQGARDQALYYRDILLPLRERILNEVQLHYNAMQVGVFQLLRVREQQIETAVAYIEALREYWLSRTDLEQILIGRLPARNGDRPTRNGSLMKAEEKEGH